jgi:hypothetical protein
MKTLEKPGKTLEFYFEKSVGTLMICTPKNICFKKFECFRTIHIYVYLYVLGIPETPESAVDRTLAVIYI